MTGKKKAKVVEQEVRKLREPQREAVSNTCCGQLMQQFQSPNLVMGGINRVLRCAKCSRQVQLPRLGGREEVETTKP